MIVEISTGSAALAAFDAFSLICVLLNSALNPYLLILLDPRIKQEIRDLFYIFFPKPIKRQKVILVKKPIIATTEPKPLQSVVCHDKDGTGDGEKDGFSKESAALKSTVLMERPELDTVKMSSQVARENSNNGPRIKIKNGSSKATSIGKLDSSSAEFSLDSVNSPLPNDQSNAISNDQSGKVNSKSASQSMIPHDGDIGLQIKDVSMYSIAEEPSFTSMEDSELKYQKQKASNSNSRLFPMKSSMKNSKKKQLAILTRFSLDTSDKSSPISPKERAQILSRFSPDHESASRSDQVSSPTQMLSRFSSDHEGASRNDQVSSPTSPKGRAQMLSRFSPRRQSEILSRFSSDTDGTTRETSPRKQAERLSRKQDSEGSHRETSPMKQTEVLSRFSSEHDGSLRQTSPRKQAEMLSRFASGNEISAKPTPKGKGDFLSRFASSYITPSEEETSPPRKKSEILSRFASSNINGPTGEATPRKKSEILSRFASSNINGPTGEATPRKKSEIFSRFSPGTDDNSPPVSRLVTMVKRFEKMTAGPSLSNFAFFAPQDTRDEELQPYELDDPVINDDVIEEESSVSDEPNDQMEVANPVLPKKKTLIGKLRETIKRSS